MFNWWLWVSISLWSQCSVRSLGWNQGRRRRSQGKTRVPMPCFRFFPTRASMDFFKLAGWHPDPQSSPNCMITNLKKLVCVRCDGDRMSRHNAWKISRVPGLQSFQGSRVSRNPGYQVSSYRHRWHIHEVREQTSKDRSKRCGWLTVSNNLHRIILRVYHKTLSPHEAQPDSSQWCLLSCLHHELRRDVVR